MASEIAQQPRDVLLLVQSERAGHFRDALGMLRKNAAHEFLSCRGERSVARAAVLRAQPALDESALLEPIDEIGYTATGHENLLLHFAEEQLSFVVERFHDGELGEGEAVPGDVARGPLGNGGVRTGQHDPEF